MASDEIVDLLTSFFEAMGKWEADCKLQFKKAKKGEVSLDAAKTEAISSLKRIFQDFCTTWTSPARVRNGFQFSTIPTYGRELEIVLDVVVSGKKAEIITRQTQGPRFTFLYHLEKTVKGWRLEDNRKIVKPDGHQDDWDL